MHACRKLRVQLKMGVDVDGRAGDGQTALCIAASEGYHTLTAALVEAGADLNLPNSQTSFTPLHSAVHAGHTEVVRVLVAAGADLSATNRRKKTALQLALSRKYTEIVQVLQGKDKEEDSDDTDSDESI
jgi:ankyrin repeat protein